MGLVPPPPPRPPARLAADTVDPCAGCGSRMVEERQNRLRCAHCGNSRKERPARRQTVEVFTSATEFIDVWTAADFSNGDGGMWVEGYATRPDKVWK